MQNVVAPMMLKVGNEASKRDACESGFWLRSGVDFRCFLNVFPLNIRVDFWMVF